jgi:hypothetical protein
MRLTHSDSEQAKLDSFLRDWPLDRVKRMSIEDYTKHGSRSSFTYALEQDKTPIGLGGGPSYKFGIYGHNPINADQETGSPIYKRDATYSWRTNLGVTSQDAFLKVRQAIVEIIEGVRRGELFHMNNSTVGRTVARKIAYLYQNPERPTLIGYFRDDLLRAHLESLGVDTTKMSLVQMHQEIIRRSNPGDNLQDLGLAIYREQQIGEVEETDDDDDIEPQDQRHLWHYTFNHIESASRGLNDQESLSRLSEINLNLDCGSLSDVSEDRDIGKTEVTRRISAATGDPNPRIRGLMGWMFAKQMKPGDLIFARIRENLFICGRVSGPYRFEALRPAFRHARTVEWLGKEPKRVVWTFVSPGHNQEDTKLQPKALTHIPPGWQNERESLLKAFASELNNLPPMNQDTEVPTTSPDTTCVIFYGPPGTGKTYRTREHAIRTCKVSFNEIDADKAFEALRNSGQVEFVTFHQSFDYSDFVVGFKPFAEGGNMVFRAKPGVLLRIAKRAKDNPEKPYLLIMDEVNRGNISKIFGELITLVEKDKRAGRDFALTITLPCACEGFLDGPEKNQFSLPPNVHFLGTMNTADRSIALIDSALRRRFDFIELAPNPKLCPSDVAGINVQTLLTKLNKSLRKELTRDHQIGHSELMFTRSKYPQGPKPSDVVNVVNLKILPQIDEWFHDNVSRKAEVLKGLAQKKEKDEDSYESTHELLKKYTNTESQA